MSGVAKGAFGSLSDPSAPFVTLTYLVDL